MKKTIHVFLIIFFISNLFIQLLCAETVYLKSGKKVEGKILEQNREYIIIDLGGKDSFYQLSEIEKIEKEKEAPVQDKKHYTSYRVTKRIKLKPTTDLYTVQCRFPLIRADFRGQISKKAILSPQYNALIKDIDKNDIALFYFSDVKAGQDINLIMAYDVDIEDSDFFVSPVEAGENGEMLNKDIEKYLKSDEIIDINKPFIKENAQKITQGINNLFSKGKAIYNFIANNIKYENSEEVSGFQSPEETLLIKRGNCADMARLFIALARASGIPARQVNGMVFSPDVSANKSIKKYEHAWAEIYLPKYGWLPVDPTTGVTSREDYYCFNYKIHIRESYGPVVQRKQGSMYKGMYIEVTTYTKLEFIPIEQAFEVEVDLLSW